MSARRPRALLSAVAILATSLTAYGAGSQHKFDIPGGSASRSLREFSLQANLQILFNEETVGGFLTREVRGDLRTADALNTMLGGTGLHFDFVNERTVAILAGPGSSREFAETLAAEDGKDAGAGSQPSAESSTPSDDNGDRRNKDAGKDRAATAAGVPEVLVRGSRSTNVDIRRSEDDVLPYVVIGREQISRANTANLESFLKAELPMNAASRDLQQLTESALSTAGGSLNLRGLGSNQTLVLVDGRRLPGVSGVGASFAQPNISGIPLSSIERIEILPTTASAIYGGSATGGAINIIRKRDYQGIEIGARYGNTFSRDVQDIDYDLSGGFAFFEGKSSITFSAAYSEGGSLLVAERDFANRSRALQLRNNPGAITNAITPATSTTPNICSAVALSATAGICGGPSLVLKNGRALNATITSVPAGYLGPQTDSGAALATNAGSYNLDVNGIAPDLLRVPQKESVSLSFEQTLTSWLDLQLSGSNNKYQSDFSVAPPVVNVFVPASSLSNPFQQPVLVSVPLDVTPKRGHTTSDLAEGAATLISHFGDWSASVGRTWARTRTSSVQRNASVLPSTGVAVLRASPSIFGDAADGLPDLSPYLAFNYDVFSGPFTQVAEGTDVRASGPVASFPAGALVLTGLFEHRNERALDAYQDNQSTASRSVFYIPRRWRSVDSFYLEGRVPLVGENVSRRGLNALELQASVRHDAYRTTSTTSFFTASSPSGPFPQPAYSTNRVDSTDYLVGLRYAPVRDLALRTSLGTGFLPAALDQIVPTTSTQRAVIATDPRRGNTPVAVPFTQIGGGNPSIEPETSRTVSAGLIWTPRLIQGLRLSLDYSRIKKGSEITLPDAQFILDNEDTYSGRVIRGAKLPTDASNWAGPVTSLDTSLINVLYTSLKAVDFQLDYRWQTKEFGNIYFSAVASQIRQLARKPTISSVEYDSVGYINGPLRWKGNGSVTWERGPWSASWSTQYFDSYLVGAAGVTPSTNASAITNQGNAAIRRQLYHDVFLSYRIPETSVLWSGMTFSLAVENALNASPPILAQGSAESLVSGSYSTYGDPRLRRYALSVRKVFGK